MTSEPTAGRSRRRRSPATTLTLVHYSFYAECAPASIDALANDVDAVLTSLGQADLGKSGLRSALKWSDLDRSVIGEGQAMLFTGDGLHLACWVRANFGCLAALAECREPQRQWMTWIEAERRRWPSVAGSATQHVTAALLDFAPYPVKESSRRQHANRVITAVAGRTAPLSFASDGQLGASRVGDLWITIAPAEASHAAAFLFELREGSLPSSLLADFAVRHDVGRIQEVAHLVEEASTQPSGFAGREADLAAWVRECEQRLETARHNVELARLMTPSPSPEAGRHRIVDQQIALAELDVARVLRHKPATDSSTNGQLNGTRPPYPEHHMNPIADALARLFSATDRTVLIRRLNVKMEEVILRAGTAEEEAWAIVDWFDRRGRSVELADAVKRERPHAFPATPGMPPTQPAAAAASPASPMSVGSVPTAASAAGSNAAAITRTSQADVLIITALKEEYDEAKKVDTGAIDNWNVDHNLTGFEVAFRTYRAEDGSLLRAALTWATRMRTTATADAAGRLLDKLGARCLAMSGVCAGRRGKVHPGDVIIGSLLYTYDTGAVRTEYDEQGQAHSRFQSEPNPVPLDEQWLHRAQAFKATAASRFRRSEWLVDRPPTLEAQGNWILAQLRSNADPAVHSESARHCPTWKETIERLRKLKFVTMQFPLAITDTGAAHIDEMLGLHRGRLPDAAPWQVHVAPIATGNSVMRDPQLFDRLSDSMRDVLGVEMEAAAIAAIAHARRLQWVVMKGVMDHADHDKEDGLKPFAARAAAECLWTFLRESLTAP